MVSSQYLSTCTLLRVGHSNFEPKGRLGPAHISSMPSTKLTKEQTAKRFGVCKAIDNFPSDLTAQEEANVKVVLKYMEVCHFAVTLFS